MTVHPVTRILDGPFIPNNGMWNAGETIGMECTVENHEEWMEAYQGKIEWMKDTQYITATNDSRYSIEDNSLVISDLKKSDAGIIHLFDNNDTKIAYYLIQIIH